MPSGFVWLMSFVYSPLMKNLVSGSVLLRHCSIEFMKQVLPRFCRPTAPGTTGRPVRDLRKEAYESLTTWRLQCVYSAHSSSESQSTHFDWLAFGILTFTCDLSSFICTHRNMVSTAGLPPHTNPLLAARHVRPPPTPRTNDARACTRSCR